jgi:hypothetical protein
MIESWLEEDYLESLITCSTEGLTAENHFPYLITLGV